MQFEISYDIDLSVLDNIHQALTKESLEQEDSPLALTVKALGNQLMAAWDDESVIALKNPGGYRQAIQEGVVYPFEASYLHFVIVNKFANKKGEPIASLFEDGYAAFDMRRMLATHGKTAEDGHKYLRIPFGHPEERLKRAGLDPEEYKNLKGSIRLPRGERAGNPQYKWGERLTDVGEVGKRRKYFTILEAPRSRFPFKTNAPAMGFSGSRFPSATTIDYTWKTSPFENLSRFVGTQGNTSGYMTFRTISEKSDPASWIHPGLRAMHIAGNAVEAIRPEFLSAVSAVAKRLIEEALARVA